MKRQQKTTKTKSRDSASRVNNLGSCSHLHFDGTIQINEHYFVLLLPQSTKKLRKLRPHTERAASASHVFKLGMRYTRSSYAGQSTDIINTITDHPFEAEAPLNNI
jgi:hypothetical protein